MLRLSTVLGVLSVVADGDSDVKFYAPWIALSFAANTMSTVLIAGRLIYERRRLSKILGHDHLVKYLTATAIVVESAVPLTLLGIVSPIVLIHSSSNLALATVFPILWLCLTVRAL